ncbi:MAG TPA: tetratricopeptide repeat protein [Kofleriaceae bacterium]
MRLFAISLFLLAACPAGKAAQTVQPQQPTVGDADPTMKSGGGGGGGVAMCKTADRADLMVVDWTPEMRGDIEVAMKEGLALVAYDCASVKLVPACALGGEYGYIGTTRREKKIEMNSKDEVAANLPVGGLSWLSDLGGKFGRESSLVAQLVMVGKRSSAKKSAERSELSGDCGGATHFVRATTVGAFVVATGSKADLAASAKILGKGASGSSSSATKIEAQDGDLESCTKSTTDGKAPPDQCGAVVRVELEPIGGESAQDEIPTASCPPGLFMADGACRGPEAPHQCKGESADCEKQCSAGHGGSCALLALMYREGTSVKKDWAKAAKLAQQACDKDVPAGCRIAGAAKLGGQGVNKDKAGAIALFDKACQAGDGKACVELGAAMLGEKKLAGGAQYAFRRACYGGGEFDGCAWLGTLYVEGKGGMTVSPKIGVKFFEKGCKEGSARACVSLADLYTKGAKGVDKDPAKAKDLYAKACNAGDEKACKHK